ncbi:MAG: acyl-CoA dehydrogenase family protein [Candidatus Binatus sp.]|uniref:acyl-CoA dehydrogenase family protein n=2 Tax=Candidatus Binatus sp. TaxID=2811406 RepID=UPI003C72D37B
MALVLNDEQTMLRDNARGFLAKNAPIAHLRALRDNRDADGFSRALWKNFVEMGWAGILIPQDYGGLELGYVEAGVVMEELGRTLTPSPFLSTAVLAATAIVRVGTDKQKEGYLPKIVAGELIATLAVDETAKHHPGNIAMPAARAGNGFKLSGTKTFVIDGHVASLLIVAARTAGKTGDTSGLTLFLVDAKSPGVRAERTATVDTHNAARITFEDVNVSADNVLGKIDAGWDVLEGVLNAGRAAVASEMVGASEEAFSRTVAYLKERKQFGKAIGEFQALQHRAAHLYCELEVTRAAVLKALQTLDDAYDRAGAIVSVAKARAGLSATLAVQEGVQMHGGIGMTDEFDIGLFMKRVRVCQELFGDSNFHADRLARLNRY